MVLGGEGVGEDSLCERRFKDLLSLVDKPNWFTNYQLPKGKQNKEVALVFSTTYNPFVNHHKDVVAKMQAVNKNTVLLSLLKEQIT